MFLNLAKSITGLHFIGREKERHNLANLAMLRGRTICISGPAGIGKTSLVGNFFHSVSDRMKTMHLQVRSSPQEAAAEVGRLLDEVYEQRNFPDFLAIDDVDGLLADDVERIARRVFNIKRIKSLILISRTELDVRAAEHMPLAGLAGEEVIEFLRLGNAELQLDSSNLDRLVSASGGSPFVLQQLGLLLQNSNADTANAALNGEAQQVYKGLILPKNEQFELIRPRLIDTNERLIRALKSDPSGIYEVSPRKFEEVVAELLVDLGYEVELTPASSDGGKDILAFLPSPHGRILCLVEAKRYRSDRPVGVELVRQLYGTLIDADASSAMMVTTSSFTSGAKEFTSRHQYKLSLRDYVNVADWIENYKN